MENNKLLLIQEVLFKKLISHEEIHIYF